MPDDGISMNKDCYSPYGNRFTPDGGTTMYHLLIADDEPSVCEGLGLIIDWAGYGFQIQGSAQNGKEALEKLAAGDYQLLITDVRMPVLDGLELIETIRARYPELRILIISGYSDFNYAKRAITYGVKGYLLKPIDPEELRQFVLSIKEELDRERQKTDTAGTEMTAGETAAAAQSPVWDLQWDYHQLLTAIEEVNPSSIEKEINLFLEEISARSLSGEIIRVLLYNIVFGIVALIKNYHGDNQQLTGVQEIHGLNINPTDLQPLRKWLFDTSREACDYILKLRPGKNAKIVNQVKDYIASNYAEPLSLRSIAGFFYMNPAYLGQLFKNAVGENFNTYLNKIRIAQVRKMMLQSDAKIHEIIEKAGYRNPEYFYRQFRRYTGMSFADYKGNINNSIK